MQKGYQLCDVGGNEYLEMRPSHVLIFMGKVAP